MTSRLWLVYKRMGHPRGNIGAGEGTRTLNACASAWKADPIPLGNTRRSIIVTDTRNKGQSEFSGIYLPGGGCRRLIGKNSA